MGKSVQYNLDDIVLEGAKLNGRQRSDFDTVVSDGSGNLDVRAAVATQHTSYVTFRGVVVEGWNDDGVHGYGTWSKIELQREAKEMLRRDYCK